MSIEVRNASKSFGLFHALKGVDLHVQNGELLALLGPSGSGKTTLLRVIAGIERPDSGEVYLSGEDHTHLPTQQRRIGFVFQHYALFKHMSVRENVAFGLRVRPKSTRPSEAAIRARTDELLGLVQIDGMADRFPSQLSGGQRQRVALARALAVEPRVLLLDEPFGALDSKVRSELRRWLRRLHDQMGITTVLVTHDQDEAMEVADRLVVMRSGRIEQVGTPDEVYHNPKTPFVCDFMGRVNIFRGRVRSGQVLLNSSVGNPAEPFSLSTHQGEAHSAAHDEFLFVRPDMLRVERETSNPSAVRATVLRANLLGPIVRLILTTQTDPEVEADIPRAHYDALGLSTGDAVYIHALSARTFSGLHGLPTPKGHA